jgi:hypothetical protein
LELAQDIARVYAEANEQTRRGINQAFFKRIKIKPRWDEDEGRTVAEVAGVELTEPFAILLADDLTEQVLAEVRRIKRASVTPDSRKRPQGALSGDYLSMYLKLAERAGFEPAMEFDPHTRLAGECLQPLGHLSRCWGTAKFRGWSRAGSDRLAFLARSEGWQSG